jgi:hypothetical protein
MLVFMHTAQTHQHLAVRFTRIMHQLLRAITSDGYEVRLFGRLLVMVWNRVHRIGWRFTARAAAGAPPPQSSKPNTPTRANPTANPGITPRQAAKILIAHSFTRPILFPRAHGWLPKLIPRPGIAAATDRLHRLIGEPEFSRLLNHNPGLARILRPLCHLLGLALPTPHHTPPRIRRRHKPRHASAHPAPAPDRLNFPQRHPSFYQKSAA